MESSSSKSLGGTAVAAARPSSCAYVELSAMAPPCQKHPVGGNFHPGREPSGESRLGRFPGLGTWKETTMPGQNSLRKFQNEENTCYSGIKELFALEAHMSRYNADIVSQLSQHLKYSQNVLEFGAGIGTLARLWQLSTGVKPQCLEIDEALRAEIERRGFNCHQSVTSVDQEYDAIYTSNVLEHIEDDLLALGQLNKIIKQNGFLGVYVPAFMSIYSGLDRHFGHYRRYDKRDLLDKIKSSGFQIVKCRYVDSIGFIAWGALKYSGLARNGGGNSAKSMELYDNYIFRISKSLDRLGCDRLFGKNILVIAQKR